MKLTVVGVVLCLALTHCVQAAGVSVGLHAPDRYDGIPEMCLMPMDFGHCRAKVKRYYFDMRRMKCTMFYWGGCAGNINNFKSPDECNKVCLDAFEAGGGVEAAAAPRKERPTNHVHRNSSGFSNNSSPRNSSNSGFKSYKITSRDNNSYVYENNNYDQSYQ